MTAPRVAARTFQDLVVWRKAHELVLAVYSFTAGFPKTETYGLALQMRRAAVSVPANIAEGFRRRGKADKARYMNMAEGSLEESRYYLILAKDLGYGDTGSLTPLLEEVSRLLNAYASDRKSTRLNSSHGYISYAVFCLKKKKTTIKEGVDVVTRGNEVFHGAVTVLEAAYGTCSRQLNCTIESFRIGTCTSSVRSDCYMHERSATT